MRFSVWRAVTTMSAEVFDASRLVSSLGAVWAATGVVAISANAAIPVYKVERRTS